MAITNPASDPPDCGELHTLKKVEWQIFCSCQTAKSQFLDLGPYQFPDRWTGATMWKEIHPNCIPQVRDLNPWSLICEMSMLTTTPSSHFIIISPYMIFLNNYILHMCIETSSWIFNELILWEHVKNKTWHSECCSIPYSMCMYTAQPHKED